MLTEIGPAGIEAPQGRRRLVRAGIVPRRKRPGRHQSDRALAPCPGLTTGEIAAHFEEVYGARVSKDTISRITEKAAGELAGWFARLRIWSSRCSSLPRP
ncbi:Transposase, Mutator family [Arthrobacter sp. OV608]|nr:Transposase, Mutator family [Arthrobacter sp. OV608]